ncbi:MAG: hypothetical protein K6E84_02925 [Lachnospiraceae bacterium]|nr:hypothetical protein [Lachnospiraceae bacterium]
MKIYNIENTKKFFNTLSECKGEVDLVNRNGDHIALNDEHLSILKESYLGGTIRELELSFENGQDAVKVFEFLSGMSSVA